MRVAFSGRIYDHPRVKRNESKTMVETDIVLLMANGMRVRTPVLGYGDRARVLNSTRQGDQLEIEGNYDQNIKLWKAVNLHA